MDNNEYLRLMEEKNKILKRLEEKKKKREKHSDRERGFNLCFNGANDAAASTEKRRSKHSKTRSKPASSKSSSSQKLKARGRRNWSKGAPVVIKAEDGAEVKVRPTGAEDGEEVKVRPVLEEPVPTIKPSKLPEPLPSEEIADEVAEEPGVGPGSPGGDSGSASSAPSAPIEEDVNSRSSNDIFANSIQEDQYDDDDGYASLSMSYDQSDEMEEESIVTEVKNKQSAKEDVQKLGSDVLAALQRENDTARHAAASRQSNISNATPQSTQQNFPSQPQRVVVTGAVNGQQANGAGCGSQEVKKDQSDAHLRSETPSVQAFVNLSMSLSESFNQDQMQGLVARFKQLNRSKRGVLLEVLEKLEQGDVQTFQNSFQKLEAKPAPLDVSGKSSKAKQDASGKTSRQKGRTADEPFLAFRILSNWGHPHLVGLTKVELYSADSKPIRVPPSAIGLRDHDGKVVPVRGQLSKLFSNKSALTSDERQMWTATADFEPPSLFNSSSKSSKSLELVLWLPHTTPVDKVKVWNFNKGATEADKGVKEAQLYFKGKLIWKGEITKGKGNKKQDYSVSIPLNMQNQGILPAPRKASSPVGGRVSQSSKGKERARHASIREQKHIAAEERRQEEEQLKQALKSLDGSFADDLVKRSLSRPSSKPSSRANSRPSSRSNSRSSSPTAAAANAAVSSNAFLVDSTPSSRRRSRPSSRASRRAEQRSRENSPRHRDGNRNGKVSHKKKEKSPSEEQKSEDNLQPSPGNNQMSLEASWDALAFFKHTQKGRLAAVELKPVLEPELEVEPEPQVVAEQTVVPTLPEGRVLVLCLLTTWGDAHYIGMAGIEIFDARGELIKFKSYHSSISASPSSLNVLPDYNNDPRVVSNLLDGSNCTCDDLHVWLAPFSKGKKHVVRIEFDQSQSISLIRVWNYNKSRIHSVRGVKDMEMMLDKQLIFRGSIAQAPGTLQEAAAVAENIVFTDDGLVLDHLEKYLHKVQERFAKPIPISSSADLERPSTGGDREDGHPIQDQFNPAAGDSDEDDILGTTVDLDLPRPKTAVVRRQPIPPKPKSALLKKKLKNIQGKEIRIVIGGTWGDPHFVGLTGLEVLGPDLKPLPITANMLTAYPQDINSVPGHSGDNRTLDKLVDATNNTLDDNHMWLAPLLNAHMEKMALGEQWLKITFKQRTALCGLRIWNYNKTAEDAHRGMKWLKVSVDNERVCPRQGLLVRKAPGNTLFDFGQTLYFDVRREDAPVPTKVPSSQRRAFADSLPSLPCGHVLKFVLYSTHGDTHYMGLSGLELRRADGTKINVPAQNCVAFPSSVNDLPEANGGDIRTLDKLVDGVNNTWDHKHMWLAPNFKKPGLIYVFFDAPIQLGMIKIWNYSKTPARGCDHMQIYMDDYLIFDGNLQKAPGEMEAKGEDFGQSVLFCSVSKLVDQEMACVYRPKGDQDVLFVDEKKLMSKGATHAARLGVSNSDVLGHAEKMAKLQALKAKAMGQADPGTSRPMTSATK